MKMNCWRPSSVQYAGPSHVASRALHPLTRTLLVLLLAVMTSAQKTCTHLTAISNVTGYLKSPGYPDHYDSNRKTCWHIEAAYPTHFVRLEAVSFRLQHDLHCVKDYLQIRDGLSTDAVIGRFCSLGGPHVTSSGRTLYLQFVTDSTVTDSGFKLRFTSVDSRESSDTTPDPDSDSGFLGRDWSKPPDLYLIVAVGGVAVVIIICTALLAFAFTVCRRQRRSRTKTALSIASTQSSYLEMERRPNQMIPLAPRVLSRDHSKRSSKRPQVVIPPNSYSQQEPSCSHRDELNRHTSSDIPPPLPPRVHSSPKMVTGSSNFQIIPQMDAQLAIHYSNAKSAALLPSYSDVVSQNRASYHLGYGNSAYIQ